MYNIVFIVSVKKIDIIPLTLMTLCSFVFNNDSSALFGSNFESVVANSSYSKYVRCQSEYLKLDQLLLILNYLPKYDNKSGCISIYFTLLLFTKVQTRMERTRWWNFLHDNPIFNSVGVVIQDSNVNNGTKDLIIDGRIFMCSPWFLFETSFFVSTC